MTVKIVVGVVCAIIILLLIDLAESISKYVVEKTKFSVNDPVRLDDRMEVSIKALQAIDVIIKREIRGKVAFLQLSNTSYNMLNLDKDVEELGKYVFQSFKSEFYNADALLITKDYIMKYITSETSLNLILAMKDANINMYKNDK